MKLKRIDLNEEPFSSAALVIDEDVQDPKIGQMVAIVLYSTGGNVIVWLKDGYNGPEVFVAGEKFVGETMAGGIEQRIKEFRAGVVPVEKETVQDLLAICPYCGGRGKPVKNLQCTKCGEIIDKKETPSSSPV